MPRAWSMTVANERSGIPSICCCFVFFFLVNSVHSHIMYDINVQYVCIPWQERGIQVKKIPFKSYDQTKKIQCIETKHNNSHVSAHSKKFTAYTFNLLVEIEKSSPNCKQSSVCVCLCLTMANEWHIKQNKELTSEYKNEQSTCDMDAADIEQWTYFKMEMVAINSEGYFFFIWLHTSHHQNQWKYQ